MTKSNTSARSITANDPVLRARVERLAEIERRGVSQMAKLLLSDQLDIREQEHGLPPIEQALAASTAG